MIKATRDKSIDLLRGIAIFLVLWGHVIQYMSLNAIDFYEDIVFRFIYGFHMGLFMFISGYLFYNSNHKYTLFSFIIKMFKTVLYPIILWNSVLFLINFPKVIIDIINGNGNYFDIIKSLYSSMGNLWFLWSLLFCSIIFAIIINLTKKTWSLIIGLFIGVIILYLLSWDSGFYIWMFPYYIGGYYFHHIKNLKISIFKTEKRNQWLWIISIISTILYLILLQFFHREDLIYLSGVTGLINNKGILYQIFVDAFRWLFGFIGIAAIYCWIHIIIPFTKETGIIYKLLDLAGHKSLQIYILQSFLLERLFFLLYAFISNRYDLTALTSNIEIYNYLITPIVAFGFLLICLMCSNIIDKIGLNKYLFGR